MSNIFISYTSKDLCVTDELLRTAQKLFSHCSNVYVDRLFSHNRTHPQLTIASKVVSSHLLIVIESESVYSSPWVLFEIALAKITLTPIVRIPVDVLKKGITSTLTADLPTQRLNLNCVGSVNFR